MNIRTIHILRSAAALLLCAAASSCSQTELDPGKGQELPQGEYPLKLTATVEGIATRVATKAAWNDNDAIGVRIYPSDGSDYPLTGQYFLNTDGSVKSTKNPLSWPYVEGRVRAWFPFVGEDEVMTADLSDQSKGLEAYDFLTAESKNIPYTETVDLVFKHQMAKVTCVLKQDEGISDEEWSTVKLSFGGYTQAKFSKGELTGSYKENNENNKWITPIFDAEASENGSPAYEALLIPGEMNGKEFIRIQLTVNVNGVKIDKELIYTPKDDSDNLIGGTHYCYTVTVKKDRLEVQSLSAEWNGDGKWHPAEPAVFCVKMPKDDHRPKLIYSNNVKDEGDHLLVSGNRFSISYIVNNDNVTKAFDIYRDPDNIYGDPNRDIMTREIVEDENNGYICVFNYYLLNEVVTLVYDDFIQIGDYYYDDGTWGPALFKDVKTPIGVVFKAGAGGDDVEDTYNKGWEKIHGYAVAINDAVDDPINWGASGQTVVETCGNTTKALAIYSGYNHTKKIKQWGEINKKAYNAVKAAIEYEPNAPGSSSGWYLPSLQQLIDIDNLPDRARLFTDVGGEDVKPYTSTNIFYWSCLEVTNAKAWASKFCTDTSTEKSLKENKTSNAPAGYVRAVLTF